MDIRARRKCFHVKEHTQVEPRSRRFVIKHHRKRYTDARLEKIIFIDQKIEELLVDDGEISAGPVQAGGGPGAQPLVGGP